MNSIRQFANSHADVIAVAILIAVMLVKPQFRSPLPDVSVPAALLNVIAGPVQECGPELSPFAMADADAVHMAAIEAARHAKLKVRQLPFRIE